MNKLFAFLLIPFYLTSCDNIGSTKVKNLVDLTPKLEVEAETPPLFSTGKNNPFKEKKPHSYTISKKAIIAEPVVAKGIMYSIDQQGYVSAFSLKEKKLLWSKNIAGNEVDRYFYSGGILFSDNKLYVTYGSRNLVVLDVESGNELIRKEFPDIIRTKPVMADDKLLLVQTISNQVIAYNTTSSKLMWMHEGGIEIISSRNHIHPVLYNGYALVSYSSGEVVYLNASNGSELWRYSLSSSEELGLPNFEPSVIITKPIISGNFAYFATSNRKIIKLDLKEGKEVWIKTADDIQSMTLHDNSLIVTNNARQIALLSTTDGKVSWTGDLISPKERMSKKPKTVTFLDPFVVKDGNSYTINVIASNGELYQFTTNDSGRLSEQAVISAIDKNIRYYWISCCSGIIHLILDTKVKF
jgi:outer membrane protein assembly factor BamB